MAATINDVKDNSFDYIIIGGGTAGLPIAARLSEDPKNSVLVLEAGEANLDDMAILRPASYASHFGNPAYDWGHQTTKQKLTGDTAHGWNRGKGLGGSSAINFLCWTKPAAEEIDDFERLGNPGWNWKNYEKYIQRAEGFVPPPTEVQESLGMRLDTWEMGKDGPLTIAFPGTIDKAERQVRQTLLNAGLPVAPRSMNGQTAGVYHAPCTYDPVSHTRSYATTAYYLPNKDRPNLKVLVSAYVNRIVPASNKDSEFTAEAVEFVHQGQVYNVHANKEVILSAGTLKSPQILELSGIGNPSILRKLGVPVKVDLPGVGKNVQEHTLAAISFELRDDVPFATLDILSDPEVFKEHLELHKTGSGAFTTGITGFAFATLPQISPRAEEIIKATEEKILKNANNYPPGLLEQYKISLDRLRNGAGCEFIIFHGLNSRPLPAEKGKRYISFYVAMNHTFSRGTIHTVSKDAAVDPEYDPHYFEEEVDLQVWIEMIKFAKNLANISPLKDMIAKELNPGPKINTDEEIAAWLKQTMLTTWHTAGACSMLPKANGGVVDPSLKVYGTNNVRVADLSVVPLHFGAHPQAVVYGIAEQAADIIKGTFRP
ncbi:alcohol oxidase [Trametes elegans]|nr:alcohol oxidase [Trametes elegans]